MASAVAASSTRRRRRGVGCTAGAASDKLSGCPLLSVLCRTDNPPLGGCPVSEKREWCPGVRLRSLMGRTQGDRDRPVRMASSDERPLGASDGLGDAVRLRIQLQGDCRRRPRTSL